MRYQSMTAADAATLLAARRADAAHSEPNARTKGSGAEVDQGFVDELRAGFAALKSEWPEGFRNDAQRNEFEGKAARLVHEALPAEPEMLSDPEFWIWLAVACLPDIVEWRYGDKEGGTKPANYGIGSRKENLLYRMWLRAELVLDEGHADRYHLANAGQIDFYRSHLFRQGYANARTFSRALIRYQYPGADDAPNLKVDHIRTLVKRLRRLRSNLFLEILPEEECRAVIETEAAVVLAA